MKTTKAIAHQISMVVSENTRFVDLETIEDLRDKKHISAVKKAREEYRKGNVTDFKKFISELK